MEAVPPSTPGPNFPNAATIAFRTFNNRYHGRRCTIVGRGPTEFDYEQLETFDDPIFFINDAVCLEKHARGETFFFAHDPQLLVWLDGAVGSTAVLPIDGKLFRGHPGITLRHAGGLVFYRWREANKQQLLRMTRDQIAAAEQLYTHSGTIHSVLHFVWFCGFRAVNFIGCDCIADARLLPPRLQTPDGYDPRLQNRSNSHSAHYEAIGRAQNLLTQLFGLEATYLGTPASR